MPVAFGFSAGDIAMAIQLLSKVYKSLKDTDGAASEFREVSQFLQGLILALQHLQKIQLVYSDPSLVKAIQALSATALQPIFQFIEEIQKYRSAMETPPLSRYCITTYRKVDWAVRVSKKVKKLRALITAEMQPIHLLVESQTLKCFDLTSRQFSLLQESLNSRATEQLAFNATIINAIKDLHSAVQGSGASKTGIPEVRSHKPKEENEIRSDISHIAVSIHGGTLPSQLAFWNENLVTLKVQQLTKYLLFQSPQLLLFLRTFFATVPRSAKLLVQDDIHFEDVLGRIHTLPYKYFNTWTVFEAYLKKEFKNVTGENYVTDGSYHIINAIHDRVISKSSLNWSRSVFPGTQVTMSVILDRKESVTSCPRCRKSLGNPSADDKKQTCSSCSWERYLNSDGRVDYPDTTDPEAATTRFEYYERDYSTGYSPWIWSSEQHRYYCWRYNTDGVLEYQWSGPALGDIQDSSGQNMKKTEPWKNEEITLFKRIHSPILTELEDNSRESEGELGEKADESGEGSGEESGEPNTTPQQFPEETNAQQAPDYAVPSRMDIEVGINNENDQGSLKRFRRVALRSQTTFFRRGRVFRMIWEEPAGKTRSDASTQGSSCCSKTSNFSYVEIRRFVVICNKGPFSLCVRIQTYGRQGTLRLGVIAEDHGIIYAGISGSKPPDLLLGENGLTKGALRVEPNGDEALDDTSRVNYRKIYKVEHNVKVLNIGVVAPEHLKLLDRNWNEAYLSKRLSRQAVYCATAFTRPAV